MSDQNKYPTSILFIFIFLTAVLFRGASLHSPSNGLESPLICGSIGGILGGLIGAHALARWRRIVLGALIGSTTGVFLAPAAVITMSDAKTSNLIAILSGGAIALLGIFFRATMRDPCRAESKADATRE